MLPPVTLEWREPLDYVRALASLPQCDYSMLYSGMKTPYSGEVSLLALYPEKHVCGEDFSPLAAQLTTDQPPYSNSWFGWLAYGLKHAVETLPADAPSYIDLPALHMTRYHCVLVFEHALERLTLHRLYAHSPHPPILPAAVPHISPAIPPIAFIASDMQREEYLQHVQYILDEIAAGTLYQANLTRKFYGEFTDSLCPEAVFIRLATASPAPYSALIKQGDVAIISSSPERFLQMDAQGQVTARPIKGSARRAANPEEDNAIRDALYHSGKDRAENLMIVDLMRNDLARSCTIGSIRVEGLYEVNTYATVHHMASTICGQRLPEVSPLELVARCFPPGSMTGAPKIRAIELCSQLEPRARGVYSGAIGWFGGDGSVDLSVVIRTLVVQKQRFEFQVGGAIVHDSTPKGEWEETLVKARGICAALELDEAKLRAL